MESMRGSDWYIMCIYQVGSGPSPIGGGPSPVYPVMRTGWSSDSWRRVAANEGGPSRVRTGRSQVSTDRSQCSSGIRDCAESWAGSWRLENAEEWERAAPSWGRTAPKADRFSSVQFSPTKLYKPWSLCTTQKPNLIYNSHRSSIIVPLLSCVEIGRENSYFHLFHLESIRVLVSSI